MADWKYDVVIVGAGPAGITAAITLARAHIPVLVLEAGVFPGAENWSGAVYFTETLAQPDVLGPEVVRATAFERPVTKRGIQIYNGHSLVGLTYHNPETFRHCYTVLRPTFDHSLAELARSFGVTILTATTATGLLRDETGRVCGVHTDRGPIGAGVVFLAEGDASHLVTQEGYERCPNGTPHFLQGIAEVIELDPGEIERRFQLPPGAGAALEIVLRNGSLGHREARLNMGGFIYTNHSSVSLGLVLPLANLAREFAGDHYRLMEWFKALPEIQRLTGGGRAVAYGAKLIRGGGFKELPQLVDHGLVLGGACTGIGLDFPYPNFTGPATAMGRLFAHAVRQAGGDFSRQRLTELYEQPLRQTHYFKNTEFLQDWPHYVEQTRVFFGRAADLATGSLYIATHPDLHAGQKLWQQAKFLRETVPLKHLGAFLRDLRTQRAALGLQRVSASATRAQRPAGAVSLTFSVDGQTRTPRFLENLAPKLRAACDALYHNDDTTLPVKLTSALRAAPWPWSMGCGLLLSAFLAPFQYLCETLWLLGTRPSPEKYLSSFFQKTRTLVRRRLNFEAVTPAQSWEDKLALIRYFPEKTSHIKVHRPEQFQQRTALAQSPLWHVCPAKVYEQKTDDLGQVQVIVNFENCIKCETCWRAAPADVDWTRHHRHRLVFSSPTPANRTLRALLATDGGTPPAPQRSGSLHATRNDRAEASLLQFCGDLAAGPRYLDAARRRWLLSLLEQAGTDRALAHARAGRFFWAEAEIRRQLGAAPSVIPSGAQDLTIDSDIEHLFPKRAIKDLEHGTALSPDQLAWLRSLPPTPEILQALAARDISLALLVAGIAHAQITARPDLANVEWIGLNTARRHAADFPLPLTPDFRSLARGAGVMLLDRCRQHARQRVQFPGLFQDEDARDGIAKFGAVKQLLSEIAVLVWRIRHDPDCDPRAALLSLTYHAGQIIGGSAYSEDDIFSKYYRDSVFFAQLLPAINPLPPLPPPAPRTELDQQLLTLSTAQDRGRPPQNDAVQSVGLQVLQSGYLPERPLTNPPAFSYRAELAKPNPYDYGDFLITPFNPAVWRYVPEMLHADPELRAYHDALYRHFTEHYWNRPGERYYRLVERLHQVPLDDVQDMIARGFTRMYIPKECGGEGLLKAHYYILCPLAMRYADPSYALTIMAHSSIGTTPILLSLYQDLPRAKADLEAFLADESFIHNLKSKIQNVLRMLDSPAALKVKDVFTKLGEQVKTDIGKKPMLRAVASDFLQHFMEAGRAGLRMDLPQFKAELQACVPALDTVHPRAEGVIAELDHRTEAAKFFLRLISAGQISAFALTEPSAGSDSGGIQTRAQLKRVEVLTDTDGAKYFLLGKERRRIVDTATVDVTNPPNADIAQIRKEGGREFYDYYELNGAKMWITNGHVAGVFCLYARTPEGPTGFLVNRHAEGLTVGRDEEKMGQRGSPTNELSLNAVRVPRENIIGIEGRGQVNALETLNVGRTGLAVSAAAMTAKIIEQTRQVVNERGLQNDPRIAQLLGAMTIEHYAAESLAYELVGRFDHPDTQSVRTESAIGKYYASEVLHRVIAHAESLLGLDGATQLHELEKHRRDARVLTIYEGTNEVQRFLILRDLVDKVLPRARDTSPLFDRLRLAVETFGAQVWQNPNFQPTMFKLAEMAGYLKALDSVRWRTDWLQAHTTAADAPHRQLAESAAAGYRAHAAEQLTRLQTEFDREFAQLQAGLYPPAIRVATLLLDQAEHPEPPPPTRSALPPAQHIVSIHTLVPVLSPRPRVLAGELLETHFELVGPALPPRPPAAHTILTVAPLFATEHLRRVLAAGADDAVLLATDDLPHDIHATARLLADHLTLRQPTCDLVVCADPLLATVLAGNLGGRPLVHVIPASPAPPDFQISDYCAALAKPLRVVNATQIAAELPRVVRYRLPVAPVVEAARAATPAAAAALVRKLTGLSAPTAAGASPYSGPITRATPAEIPTRNAAVFLGTVQHLDGIGATAAGAAAWGLEFHVVVAGAPDETAMRALAAQVPATTLWFVTSPHLPGALGPALQTLWKDTLPAVLAADPWAEELLARFANTFPRVQAHYGVSEIADGEVTVPVFGGQVQRVVSILPVSDHPLVMTVQSSVVSGQWSDSERRVFCLPLDLPAVAAAAPPAAPRPTTLADADVLIDVGYAVRDREKFDLVVAPLKKRLEELGVKNVMVGGTRKVVEELKLLAPPQQIGQTGTAVNPTLLIALGVSGAPQHADYIGEQATVIAFNRDAEAPLMTLNQRKARPRVIPIVGDLYETVPEFMKAL